MKTSKVLLALASCLVAGAMLASLGCTKIYTGGDSINQIVTGPGPVTSPSPGSQGSGLVATVKIGEFGEKCPAGKEPAEQVARQLRVGCTSAITCTPKDAQGLELPHDSPVKVDAFLVISGGQYVKDVEADKPFNHDVFGVAPGLAVFICKVAGVSSDAWPLEIVP